MTFIYKKFVPAVLYFIIITILFCLPGSALPDTGGDWFKEYHIDKIIHATIFTFLVFIFCRPIQFKGFLNSIVTKIYFLIAIIFSFYGILIEFIQKWWIKGRSFDDYDIIADVVGCFIGYFIAKRIVKNIKQPSSEELQNQLMDYAKKFVQK